LVLVLALEEVEETEHLIELAHLADDLPRFAGGVPEVAKMAYPRSLALLAGFAEGSCFFDRAGFEILLSEPSVLSPEAEPIGTVGLRTLTAILGMHRAG